MIPLDRHWKQSQYACPICNDLSLLVDMKAKDTATHYCVGCNTGMKLIFNAELREDE